ncbi:hypothetical protein [uncultured Bacteroides sp.]|uniref:hypothetical protein n=1 Tax=uncultured Bacteroides sp. TaxID=162156 RepID=UPI0025B5F0CD|nr:hypothetical protein [uncultured Bacteroides sp.]
MYITILTVVAEDFECLIKLTLDGSSHFSCVAGCMILLNETIQFISKPTSRFPRWITKE